MKSTEFRIGNLAKEITHSSNEIVEVSVRHFEDIEQDEIDLFPIPITEDWLNNLGFNQLDYGFYRHKDIKRQCRYILYKGLDSGEKLEKPFVRFDGLSVDIFYVHEFQNFIYALTKIELTPNK